MNGGVAVEAGQVLVLYFAAQWCPDCRAFTPVFRQFHRDVNGNGERVKVVWVSSESGTQDFDKTLAEDHGDYVALRFGDGRISDLKRRYGVCARKELAELMAAEARKGGIPTVAVVDAATGNVLSLDGQADIEELGVAAADKWLKLTQSK